MAVYTVITREQLAELPMIPMGRQCKHILWIATGELHPDTGYSLVEIYGTNPDGTVAGAFTRSADAFELATGVRLECVVGCRGTVAFGNDSEFTCQGSPSSVTIKRVRNGVEEPGLMDYLSMLLDKMENN